MLSHITKEGLQASKQFVSIHAADCAKRIFSNENRQGKYHGTVLNKLLGSPHFARTPICAKKQERLPIAVMPTFWCPVISLPADCSRSICYESICYWLICSQVVLLLGPFDPRSCRSLSLLLPVNLLKVSSTNFHLISMSEQKLFAANK